MSTSRTKNFRRRADGDDEDDDNNFANSAAAAATTTTTTKRSSSKPTSTTATTASASKPKKPPKLLSFGDDEEAESPSSRSSARKPSSRLSKTSSSSHKITSIKDRLKPTSSSSSFLSNVQPQAGTYTKEALLELQKNTRTLAAPSKPQPSSEPIFLLKGLVKPSSQTSDHSPQLQSESLADEPEEDRDRARARADLFTSDRLDAQSRLGSIGITGKKGKDSESLILDQAAINAIRAKRERLRQSRAAAPDFISLDAGSNHGAAEGLSDEEPEFQNRIAMFGSTLDGGKKGVFEDVDDRVINGSFRSKDAEYNNENDDEDEEDKMWEEEQVRKGLGKRLDDGSSSTRVMGTSVPVVQNVQQHQDQTLVHPANQAMYGSQPSVPAAPSIGGAIGPSLGLDAMSIPQQAEIAKKALLENARRLKESHVRTISSLTQTDENLSTSLLNITTLEESLSAAEEKFIFMQKFRDFVSVICDFLQHKAPFIEELEEQMQKLHEDRASVILERRAADNDDEMMEIDSAVKAAMSVFSERGSSAAMVAVAKNAAQAASAAMREQTNLPVKLDEFGRDMNLQKRMDMTRRAEAREHRKTRFDSKRISSMEIDSSFQRIEGESSSDESDSESSAYQSNRDLLLLTADQIFSDASEEYSQLSVVKEKFEIWKRQYLPSYRDAYMSLSVPAIFSPYVRLELLKWDPLHEDADFLDMKWHSLLFDYGKPEDGSDFTSEDIDANLVPKLVESVAVPILHHEISHCWDMLSTQETKYAVSATSMITAYVPASSEALVELLVAIRTRLADAVTNIMVPTWTPLVLKAVPNAARVAAYRFGMSVRLLRNICLWKEILALPVLEKLALDELLCGKILPHVRNITSNIHDAVKRTERIIDSLSGVWAGPSATGNRSRKLQPLVDSVLLLGKTLEKKHVSGVTESETGGLARRIKKMLVELNEYDCARDIARTFHLKEAL